MIRILKEQIYVTRDGSKRLKFNGYSRDKARVIFTECVTGQRYSLGAANFDRHVKSGNFLINENAVKADNALRRYHELANLRSAYEQLNESIGLMEATYSQIKSTYYKDIPDDIARDIAAADTVTTNLEKEKLGEYGKWLLDMYKRGNLLANEDLEKATEYIEKYDKLKKSNKLTSDLKDIKKFKTLSDMYVQAIKPFEDSNDWESKTEKIKNIKSNEAEEIRLNDPKLNQEWQVIHPKTEAAACLYGKGTQWCTAATNGRNPFNKYNSEGPLYIVINRRNGDKYQFHYQSEQFMDANDEPIEWKRVEKSLYDVYKELSPYEKDGKKYENCREIELGGKNYYVYTLFSKNGIGSTDIYNESDELIMKGNGRYELNALINIVMNDEGSNLFIINDNWHKGGKVLFNPITKVMTDVYYDVQILGEYFSAFRESLPSQRDKTFPGLFKFPNEVIIPQGKYFIETDLDREVFFIMDTADRITLAYFDAHNGSLVWRKKEDIAKDKENLYKS